MTAVVNAVIPIFALILIVVGSFAGQSAFATAGDITARTDGAVFVGTPSFSEPWGTIEAGRDPGSPQWQPVYRGGQSVRFA